MANVRCRSCGKTYRYVGDTCPNCGAYNRPPQQEYVDVDGTVHRVELSEKVCYEEKECHERKECHEDEGRRFRHVPRAGKASFSKKWDKADSETPRHSGFSVREEVSGKAAALGTAAFKARRRASRGDPKLAIILGAVIALISFGISAFENLHFDRLFHTPEPVYEEPASAEEEAVDETVYSSAEMGEAFRLDGDKLVVRKWTLAESDPHIMLVWVQQPDNDQREAELCCWQTDGEYHEAWLYPEDCFPDGNSTCYVFTDIPFEGDYAAVLNFYAYNTANGQFHNVQVMLKVGDEIEAAAD